MRARVNYSHQNSALLRDWLRPGSGRFKQNRPGPKMVRGWTLPYQLLDLNEDRTDVFLAV